MARTKTVLAAGYVRDLLFTSEAHAQGYIQKLDYQGVEYKILDSYRREDGTVIIRVLQQYNNSPLISLYNE